jgi:hypothetical protein
MSTLILTSTADYVTFKKLPFYSQKLMASFPFCLTVSLSFMFGFLLANMDRIQADMYFFISIPNKVCHPIKKNTALPLVPSNIIVAILDAAFDGFIYDDSFLYLLDGCAIGKTGCMGKRQGFNFKFRHCILFKANLKDLPSLFS